MEGTSDRTPPSSYPRGIYHNISMDLPLTMPLAAAAPSVDHGALPLTSIPQDHLHPQEDVYFSTFPPGYRFRPTDSELIDYLKMEIQNDPLPTDRIQEVNLYDHHPKTLTDMYREYAQDNCWYFFSSRDKRYPRGKRPNRSTKDSLGYWKAASSDKDIECDGVVIGTKKSLVYYEGKAPSGDKTRWLMKEYGVPKSDDQDKNNTPTACMLLDQVLCKVYTRQDNSNQRPENANTRASAVEESVQQEHSDVRGPKNHIQQEQDEELESFLQQLEAEMSAPEMQPYSLQQLPEFGAPERNQYFDYPLHQQQQQQSNYFINHQENYYNNGIHLGSEVEDQFKVEAPPPESIGYVAGSSNNIEFGNNSFYQFSGYGGASDPQCSSNGVTGGAPQLFTYGVNHHQYSVGFFDASGVSSIVRGRSINVPPHSTHSTIDPGFISTPAPNY